MSPNKRALHLLLLATVVALPACAGSQKKAAAPVAARDASAAARGKDANPYRFDMTQRGKQMSADDFDAWMKARGLRVAQGKPVAKASKKTKTSASGTRD